MSHLSLGESKLNCTLQKIIRRNYTSGPSRNRRIKEREKRLRKTFIQKRGAGVSRITIYNKNTSKEEPQIHR